MNHSRGIVWEAGGKQTQFSVSSKFSETFDIWSSN